MNQYKYLLGTGERKGGEKEKKKENKNDGVHASELSPDEKFCLHFSFLSCNLVYNFEIFHHFKFLMPRLFLSYTR